jgi:Fe2+ transport system protein FeoA
MLKEHWYWLKRRPWVFLGYSNTSGLKLTDLHNGQRAILADFSVSSLHQRLLTMGFGPGAMIRVVRRLRRHGNMYISINGRNLIMRFAEADSIYVKIP